MCCSIEVLACALSVNFQHCFAWQLIVQAVFPHPFPPLFPLFIQCDGCLFPFPAWGLMAGLPGFASHGSSLHLGAGCQYWKLLDVSDNQPRLSDAVVNCQLLGIAFLLVCRVTADPGQA